MRLIARPAARVAAVAGWRADVAAALAGALAALALPPLHLLPVLLLAVPGLLALIGAAPRARVAFRRGFWFGFGQHLLGLYWITDAILIEAARYFWFVPIAVPALSALLALFIALPCALAWYARPGWRRALALAAAWTLADLARQFIATGFPWNPWGSVWAMPGIVGTVFLQPLAWVGTPGLTMATVLLATLPSLGRRARLAGATAVVAWAALGAWRLGQPAGPAPGVTAVLVQGNVAEGAKWERSAAIEHFRRHLALTAAGVAQAGRGRRVVIWPETASPFALQTDAAARLAIAEAANDSGGEGVTALVGSVRFSPSGRPLNSLFAVSPTGEVLGVYDKWHLVPGGEFQPDWLPLPVQIVPGGGFQPGPGPRTLHLPGLPAVGPLICYEAIFPAEVAEVADRPDWLANVTNDAWFGNSTGPRQHLQAARMRAVEQGLPLLRAANTGISAVFDAHGRELARLGLGQAGVLVEPLPGRLPQTWFGRYGLWVPGLIAGVALLLAFLSPARRRGEG